MVNGIIPVVVDHLHGDFAGLRAIKRAGLRFEYNSAQAASFGLLQRGQVRHDADAFQADPDDAFKQVNDVARIGGPGVGIVLDAAGLVASALAKARQMEEDS